MTEVGHRMRHRHPRGVRGNARLLVMRHRIRRRKDSHRLNGVRRLLARADVLEHVAGRQGLCGMVRGTAGESAIRMHVGLFRRHFRLSGLDYLWWHSYQMSWNGGRMTLWLGSLSRLWNHLRRWSHDGCFLLLLVATFDRSVAGLVLEVVDGRAHELVRDERVRRDACLLAERADVVVGVQEGVANAWQTGEREVI